MIAMIMIDAEEKKSMSNVSSALGTGGCQVGRQKFAFGVRRLLMTFVGCEWCNFAPCPPLSSAPF